MGRLPELDIPVTCVKDIDAALAELRKIALGVLEKGDFEAATRRILRNIDQARDDIEFSGRGGLFSQSLEKLILKNTVREKLNSLGIRSIGALLFFHTDALVPHIAQVHANSIADTVLITMKEMASFQYLIPEEMMRLPLKNFGFIDSDTSEVMTIRDMFNVSLPSLSAEVVDAVFDFLKLKEIIPRNAL